MTIDRLQYGIRLAADALIKMLQQDATDYPPELRHWDWQQGVGLYGLIRAYETLGEPAYLEYCKLYVDRLLAEDKVSYSINGAIVFETVLKLYEHLGEERYRVEMRYFLRWLLRSAAKCQNGCFEHSWFETDVHLVEQVWIDTLFMAGIVLADSARLFEREDCRAEVFAQFAAHQACLQDPATGLYRHFYDGVKQSYIAGAFWGRGNGWLAASLVDMLTALGLDDPGCGELVASFQRQMAAVALLQEANGMFHTILDDPATYLEMSATAALGYAALRGTRLGILAAEFQSLGDRAVTATLANIKKNGIVTNVSSGTGGFISYEAYNQIPIAPRWYGQALAILLLCEALEEA